ncbi:hypothetical protein BYT27DRAFT_7208871 [Phlegmacium glaucopus]|nr:hypothetical protein BYT27DRAFT_7208871 [Phlegmacium glaucopus]
MDVVGTLHVVHGTTVLPTICIGLMGTIVLVRVGRCKDTDVYHTTVINSWSFGYVYLSPRTILLTFFLPHGHAVYRVPLDQPVPVQLVFASVQKVLKDHLCKDKALKDVPSEDEDAKDHPSCRAEAHASHQRYEDLAKENRTNADDFIDQPRIE